MAHWNPCVLTIAAGVSPLARCRLAADGRSILACAMDGRMTLWDAETGLEIGRFEQDPADTLCAAAISADGRLIAGSTEGRPVRLWQVDRGRLRGEIDAGAVRDLLLLPDGSRMVALTWNTLSMWHVSTGRCDWTSSTKVRPTMTI